MPSRCCSARNSSPICSAQLGVEIGQRLVEQQHLRLEHQRARDRDALLLAAGQRGRRPLGERLHLDELQRRRRRVSRISGGWPAADAQRIGDVVEHRHVRPDGVGLEHHAEPAVVRRHEDAARRRR